jgi:hypothetical protein
MAIASVATAAVFIRQGIVHGLLGLTTAFAVLLLLGAVMEWRVAARLRPSVPYGQLRAAYHLREISALAILIIVTAVGAAVLAIFT